MRAWFGFGFGFEKRLAFVGIENVVTAVDRFGPDHQLRHCVDRVALFAHRQVGVGESAGVEEVGR